MKNYLNERIFIALVTAFLAIAAVIAFRPADPYKTGLNSRWFRFAKLQWHQVADVVIAGDSRVMCDLSPAEMGKYFPGMRIYNFGFLTNAFTSSYLSRTMELFDPASGNKTIIFGISPQAFTRFAARAMGRTFRRPKIKSQFVLDLAKFYFETDARFSSLLDFSEKKDYEFYEHYSPDGWLASDRIPRKTDGVLMRYRRVFSNNKIDKEMIATFMAFVKKSQSEGIKVIAFRPPVDSELRVIEDGMSGFDEQSFVKAFETAGGIWIEMPKTDELVTFDGHHLRKQCALEFSRKFALQAAKIEKAPRTEMASLESR
jgi:hypothetical protein